MRRRLLKVLLVAAGLSWTVGCGDAAGTFVRVKFTGTVSQAAPVRRIAVDLQMDRAKSSTTFEAPNQTGITLPTDAILDIGAGEGLLVVTAKALAADGVVLGTGVGSGNVVRNQTTELSVVFGGELRDAGLDGVALDGAAPDSALDGVGSPTLDTAKEATDLDGGVDRAGILPVDLAEDVPATGGVSGTGGAGGVGGSPDGGSGGLRSDSGAGGIPSGTGGGSGGSGGSGGIVQGGTGGSGTGGALGPDAPLASHHLTATPPSLDFGVVVPGTTSPAQSLTITNDGDAASPPLVVSLASGKGFAITENRCAGVTLGLKSTCVLTLTFTPATTGIMQQDGSVGGAGEPGAIFHLNGAGAGTKAELLLTPSAVDFRQVDVGSSASADFTLRNIGTLDAGAITVAAGVSPAFRIANDSCTGKNLAGQGSCFFTLIFTPTTFGPASVTVTARNSAGLSAAANVIGTGRDLVTVTVLFAGTGSGTVTGPGLSCASNAGPCNLNVPRIDPSATYTVSAFAASGSTFAGWSGAGCSGTGPCNLSLASPPTVTATFSLPLVPLSVLKSGDGDGTVTSDAYGINCGSACTANVPPSTTVTLTAVASPGSSFSGWTGGGCSGTDPCPVNVAAAMSVTATFALNTYALNVTKSGNGTGSVQSTDGAIVCGTSCSANLKYGDKLTLIATPDVSSIFAGWSGGGCTGTDPCTVVIGAATTVNAKFTLKRVTLTVKKMGTGEGKVSSDPGNIVCGTTCSAAFDYGTKVELTASPAILSTFVGWAGPVCSGTGTCTMPITEDTTAFALFNTGFSCGIVNTARSCLSLREYNVVANDYLSCRTECEAALQKSAIATGCWTFNADGKCICTSGSLVEGGSLWGGACADLPR